ncbi:hypothetical protein Tco_0878636 [Tanacetum coccineum]|uniref:Uncharacterized protein n=1 Tax=Tanacetum coccineum TaxID=301880 RepID=A0ABQ5BYG3_9ASTR
MSTPCNSITSCTELFISLIIMSDSEDEDTTVLVVSAPSSPDRMPASSGYSPDFDLDSEPTKYDSSDEDLMKTAELTLDLDCFDIICSATIHPFVTISSITIFTTTITITIIISLSPRKRVHMTSPQTEATDETPTETTTPTSQLDKLTSVEHRITKLLDSRDADRLEMAELRSRA